MQGDDRTGDARAVQLGVGDGCAKAPGALEVGECGGGAACQARSAARCDEARQPRAIGVMPARAERATLREHGLELVDCLARPRELLGEGGEREASRDVTRVGGDPDHQVAACFDLNRRLRKEGLKRMFLHARSLEFAHPLTGEPMRIESTLPKDLADFWSRHSKAPRVSTDEHG